MMSEIKLSERLSLRITECKLEPDGLRSHALCLALGSWVFSRADEFLAALRAAESPSTAEAVEAEREACAKIAEDYGNHLTAEAIRDRARKEG
jgi:hypothetical protein